ncbi:ABC transporter substrate-binding protein [Duganella sp. BuS-21]|uniref:ABC transporter substrate-binding protein n=1 Tax=Duganella sp. BuS-21 TaxID=2943848 RepID=UPI0035A66CBE
MLVQAGRGGYAARLFLSKAVFDNLVYLDTAGEPTPWLARSWKVSPDGRVYTFVLRRDVTFSDGTRFDAEAVRIRRAMWTPTSMSRRDADAIRLKEGRRLSVELLTTGDERTPPASVRQIQADLQRVGIELRLKPIKSAELSDVVTAGQYDALTGGWWSTRNTCMACCSTPPTTPPSSPAHGSTSNFNFAFTGSIDAALAVWTHGCCSTQHSPCAVSQIL